MVQSFTRMHTALFNTLSDSTAGTYYRPDPADADNPLAAATVVVIRGPLEIDYPDELPLYDRADVSLHVRKSEIIDTGANVIEPDRKQNDYIVVGSERFQLVHPVLDASGEVYELICRRI